MDRRSVPAIALALGCAACSGSGPEPARGPARRVILVTCDTLRADRLGIYGYARPTSPRVDAFAREGVVFDEAYSCAPWTGPALSALLAGRLPDEIGVPGGNRYPMPPEAVTIAELARDRGVATAAVVSNWVLRRPDRSLGDAGVAQGFEHFDDEMPVREENRESYERLAPATTDAALAWVDRHARERGEDPFFLWVHYQDPHGPYAAPADVAARFERPPTDEPELPLGRDVKGKGQLPSYQALGAERRPEVYRARYDAEIALFDAELGRFLDGLRARGLYDEALIVLSADHGESLGEHGYWFCHGENVWREIVRVPLVVRFPPGCARVRGEAREGCERVGALASHLDLWPTILGALGVEAPPNRGASLLQERLPEGRVHAQTFSGPSSPRRWTGVADGRWRLVVAPGEPPKLFDVAADPYETDDLARRHPELVADLSRRFQEFVRLGAGAPLAETRPSADPATESALRRMGYTDVGDDGDGH